MALLDGVLSEAAMHYGGRTRCLADAIQARHRLYKQFESPLHFWFYRRDRLEEMRQLGLA